MKRNMMQAAALLAAMVISAGAYARLVDRFEPVRGDAQKVSERQAATVYVGSKRVVAFYVADSGGCNVTVGVSETYPEQVPYHFASVRFSTSVAEGSTAEVAASDGAALALTCVRGAKALALAPFEVTTPIVARATN